MYTLYYGNDLLQITVDSSIVCEIPSAIKIWKGLAPEDYYITQCGRRLDAWHNLRSSVPLRINERLTGGKGGFGSMLRAIGAQIEKTTNRDACRDLSGRRLRDINEEERLKACTAKQQYSSKNDHNKILSQIEKLTNSKPNVEDQQNQRGSIYGVDMAEEAINEGLGKASKRKRSPPNRGNAKRGRDCSWIGMEHISSGSETDSQPG